MLTLYGAESIIKDSLMQYAPNLKQESLDYLNSQSSYH